MRRMLFLFALGLFAFNALAEEAPLDTIHPDPPAKGEKALVPKPAPPSGPQQKVQVKVAPVKKPTPPGAAPKMAAPGAAPVAAPAPKTASVKKPEPPKIENDPESKAIANYEYCVQEALKAHASGRPKGQTHHPFSREFSRRINIRKGIRKCGEAFDEAINMTLIQAMEQMESAGAME